MLSQGAAFFGKRHGTLGGWHHVFKGRQYILCGRLDTFSGRHIGRGAVTYFQRAVSCLLKVAGRRIFGVQYLIWSWNHTHDGCPCHDTFGARHNAFKTR